MKAEETTPRRVPHMISLYEAWGSAVLHVVLAVAQLVLFAPTVAAGQALDLSLFRVDGLALVFGVAWCLGAAAISLQAVEAGQRRFGTPLAICLMTAGALGSAYAREPLVLWLGWEAAGLGLWLVLRCWLPGRVRARWTGVSIHAAGWPLLLLIVLGVLVPFAPPAGGVAGEWSWSVALALGVAAMVRAGLWPLGGWTYPAARAGGAAGTRLLGVYCMLAPLVLMKILVAAPWGPVGSWLLALLATAALAGTALRGHSGTFAQDNATALASGCGGIALLGVGLASGSPAAAAGAVAVVLCGIAWASMAAAWPGRAARWGLLAGLTPGIWLIAQAALGLRYGLAGVALLPLAILPVVGTSAFVPTGPRPVSRYTRLIVGVGFLALILFAAYPQAVVDFAVRPAVEAMAGGVAALSRSGLQVDAGVGLLVSSAQEGALATWPATGIALAVYLAWVALHWLRGLVGHYVPAGADEEEDSEE